MGNLSKNSSYGVNVALGVNYHPNELFGMQVGAGNGALKLRGCQVGFYNVCGEDSKGVQIGFLNRRENAPWYAKVIPFIAIRNGKSKKE
ncbi:hypothetical protein J4225_00880 [Candidatus Pacearchaeota archaeon]|nr:hypothetical protein [Candidatus Pacearchaeota archaeon]